MLHAAETVCNDNGGAGWPFPISSTTNINIPYVFADASIAYDVDISVDVSKTYVGDLTARITSPQGTTVWLFERPGTALDENTATAPWGCANDDIVATFDDEAASGIPVENVCTGATPTINGTFLPHNAPAGNAMSLLDGEDPTGNWGFEMVHVAPFDPGVLNEVCVTAAFAAITFDQWVSTDPSCTDQIETEAVAPGTEVYFCYTVSNPGTETFDIGIGDIVKDLPHNTSGLQVTYNQNDTVTVNIGPVIAGTASLPFGTTTVNDVDITANYSTANFTGTLLTSETVSLDVGDPVFSTSTKSVVDLNGGSVDPGDVLEYTITINETGGFKAFDIELNDVVDANLGSINFTTLPPGSTNNTVANNINITNINVQKNSSTSIVFEATIGLATPAGTNINNTAVISHADSGVSANAVAPAVVVSAANLSTSTKSVLDVNGGSLLPGDLVRYTISINESAGLPASSVQLIDIVDANLAGISVTNNGGGTDNSSGNTIDISGISVPASGSVNVVFEATVVGGASVGTSINNTAIITDNVSGIITNAVSPTLVVSATPSSGTKLLYLDNLGGNAGDLTRSDPSAIVDSNTANLDANGEFADFTMTPVFQAPFTISAGNYVAQLSIERNNRNSTRDVQVDLYKVSGGNTLIASDTVTGLSRGTTSLVNFNLNVASDVSFVAGDTLMLRVTNVSVENNNHRIRVHSNLNGLSQIPLDTPTVINLDSIGVYAAAYPSTLQFKSYSPGSTVYLRTTVSDPFGFLDINSVDFTVTDPTPALLMSTNVTAPVVPAAGASGIYETSYTIPDPTTDGIWSIGFTANEGYEGTISHSATANVVVGAPLLNVSKNAQTISDPVNTSDFKSIPNAIVEYSIGIENSGYGYVDINSIVLTDPVATGTTFYFGSPLNPADLVDGATASGLSFTFTSLASTTDDIDFSNDGGSSYITPSVDANGFDITVPPINYIRLSPKGEFRGSDGVNDPSMEIRFRVRVE